MRLALLQKPISESGRDSDANFPLVAALSSELLMDFCYPSDGREISAGMLTILEDGFNTVGDWVLTLKALTNCSPGFALKPWDKNGLSVVATMKELSAWRKFRRCDILADFKSARFFSLH